MTPFLQSTIRQKVEKEAVWEEDYSIYIFTVSILISVKISITWNTVEFLRNQKGKKLLIRFVRCKVGAAEGWGEMRAEERSFSSRDTSKG